MAEPVTLTAAMIVTLAFTKFLESGAGELGKKFTETAITKMEQLRQKISEKLQGNRYAESALTAVQKERSERALGQLELYLQQEMDRDPQFAYEVKTLAEEINKGKLQDNSTMVQNVYDNARAWQVKAEGGTNYIGEINFHGQSPNPQ